MASPETIQSDPRFARAILSAPYPLASIRTRSYILLRPVNPQQNHPINGQRQQVQAVAFVPNAPYFYGPSTEYGQQQALPPTQFNHAGATGMGGWPVPIAVPTPSHHVPATAQTSAQQAAAQQLDTALRSPMDISIDGGGAAEETATLGPLHIAHEIGRLTAQPNTSGPKGPPSSLNLLTSTFQTVLPRSLLEFRQIHEALDSPPKLTSSTSFFTGVTAGGGPTATESPTTPIGPAKRRMPVSLGRGRRYGQRERESSSDEDSGWSSDATLTQRRSPLSPRLETPATPRPIPARPSQAASPIRPSPRPKRQNRRNCKDPTSPPAPLFLGQTNLSPFTYEPATRRRHPASNSSMSLLGFDSDATTIIRVPRSFAERRVKRGSGGLFWTDKGKKRMQDLQEEPDIPGHTDQPLFMQAQQMGASSFQQEGNSANSYTSGGSQAAPQALGSPTRTSSPTPMSIDPQSANPITQTPNWPHQPQSSLPMPAEYTSTIEPPLPGPLPPQPTRTHQLPFTKACHNFLLVRHRQAARKRKLLLDYHRRVRAEEEEEASRMQVDTPAVPSFPSDQQDIAGSSGTACNGVYTTSHISPRSFPAPPSNPTTQLPQPSYQYPPAQPLATSPQLADRHEVTIRNIASIARIDESKPARKRRRDLSPESSYQPFMINNLSPDTGPQKYMSPVILEQRPSMLRSVSLEGTNPGAHLTVPTQPVVSPSQRHSLPNSTQAGLSTLLPSIEIRTPAQNRSHSATHPNRRGTSTESGQQGTVRISAGQYGFFEFDKSRAEDMDRRLMEEMKLARRDAWLEDLGERRGSGGKKGKGRR